MEKKIIKIESLQLEESVQNKGAMLLIAIDESGKKWVVSGDPYMPTYVREYDGNFYTDKSLKVN